MPKRLRCVSLFTGAGLMDEGLRQAGLAAGVCYELDRDACDSARLNGFPATRAWFGRRRPDKFRGVPSVVRLPPADVVWGGPPCQSFSVVANPSKPGYGGRRGTDCDNGRCLLDCAAAGAEAGAMVVLIENVPPVAKPVVLEMVSRWTPGYEVIVQPFNALSWLPQSRSRVFLLVARAGRIAGRVRAALAASPPPVDCGATLRGCIGHLSPLSAGDEVVSPTPPQAAIMRHLRPGGNWSDVPASVIRRHGLPCLRECPSCGHEFRVGIRRSPDCPRCGRRRDRRSTHYRRASWDGRAGALVTETTSSSTFLAHPDGERLLSVREYMALQGLPGSYRLAGSVRSKFKQLGNGVPVPAAKWIGGVILSALA